MWTKFCILFVAGSALMFAQHGYTPSDAEAGGLIFQSGCSRCHGQDGDGVPPMNLLRGKFRRTYSDDELIKIIQTGIAGTAMPPGNYSNTQARTVVAYFHSMADAAVANTAPPGDPARGKALVDGKAGCLNCHRIEGVGGRMGPDLSNIGALRNSRNLEQSILDPDAEIAVDNRFVKLTMRDGTVVTGKLLNQDVFTVQFLDDKEHLRSVSRSDLRGFAFLDKSPMPSFKGKLTPQELGDVVSYLHSLKGVDNQ